jgi:hypothetical protein
MKAAWCLGQAMAGLLFWGAYEPVDQDYAAGAQFEKTRQRLSG